MDIETLRRANHLSGLNDNLKEIYTDLIFYKNKGKNENLSKMIEAINLVIADLIKETRTEFNNL